MVYFNHPPKASTPSPFPGACVLAIAGTHAEPLVYIYVYRLELCGPYRDVVRDVSLVVFHPTYDWTVFPRTPPHRKRSLAHRKRGGKSSLGLPRAPPTHSFDAVVNM